MDLLAAIFGEGDQTWRLRANCRGLDPDLFHPEQGESADQAKAVCRGCVVRSECLDYAIANSERSGIWGGCGEKERRAIRRARLSGQQAKAS